MDQDGHAKAEERWICLEVESIGLSAGLNVELICFLMK